MALNHLGIHPLGQALGGNHREPRGVAKACFFDESVPSSVDFLVFFFVEFVLVLTVFDLTNIDDFVGSFNDDVDLDCWFRGFASP